MTLLPDVNHPGSQEDVVSNWKPAHSLGKMLSLGPRLQQPLAFRLWLSHTCLSALGELGEEGSVCSLLALLWYSLNPLFCDWARLHIRAFCTFSGKFPFFLPPPPLVIPQFGLLSHISSLRLSSGYLVPVLTLSNDYAAQASLSSSCSLVVDMSIWATSPLAVAVRHYSRFVCLFVFSSRLCCPLRFQNSL